MKSKLGLEVILSIGIIIIFSIFTILYFTQTKNIRDNETKILNNNSLTFEANNNSIYNEIVSLSKYTTNIYDKDKNRIHNITLACKTLNGTVVKPNQEFSFNNTLGSMSYNDGYKLATGFDSNGNNIKVYGGGICQLSSTLYNAVLIADLKVTERHAHSKRVYYVPKNKDATVFSGGPDFKFINNTNNDIIIYSSTDGYSVTVELKKK